MQDSVEIADYQCYEHLDIVTPINIVEFEKLLIETNFEQSKRDTVVQGFKRGFDLGYTGSLDRKLTSDNIPFTVGDPVDMWNKIMKEVSLGRFAGPYTENDLPFQEFVQSPIGLVPKSGGKTRLIFHLSYNFSDQPADQSINALTPHDKCTVKYKDLYTAVSICLHLLTKDNSIELFYGKSDLVSAFRILPILPEQRCLLVMKARHPITKIWYYFVDKCLPFGSSVSCSHFQLFSDALTHVAQNKFGLTIVNYLDDFLFIHTNRDECNNMVRKFLELCETVNCPVSEEKTECASTLMVFLGILLDGKNHCLAIPQDKKLKALNTIQIIKEQKKVTIKVVQKLTGLLNFLQRAVVPGCPFNRCMYDKLKLRNKKGELLKHYHHIKLDAGFKQDWIVWETFLKSDSIHLCRPFVDFADNNEEPIFFYSDASLSKELGYGAVLAINGSLAIGEANL